MLRKIHPTIIKRTVLNPNTMSRHSSTRSVPSGAWDSHMHVADPIKFPISTSATYKPHAALLPDALRNAEHLELPNLVIVQPSTYGNDNLCLLDALGQVGPVHGRGVVAFDPHTTPLSTLKQWHEVGVRGVRVNLKSVQRTPEPAELRKELSVYLDAIRPLKTWVLELFIDMSAVPHLEPLLEQLGDTKIALAHLGAPAELKPTLTDMPGYVELLRLMEHPNFFVKISAPYRVSRNKTWENLELLTKELLQARGGDGVVFASDWPHTRFEGMDVKPWVEQCLEWCGDDDALANKLFRDNAKVLWDIKVSVDENE
jgi:predicted TIM-barrel fold metal-dependent hydrolase